MHKLLNKVIAIASLGLMAPLANAGVLSIDFSSVGLGYASDTCGKVCYEINTQGLAYETSGLPGTNAWSFQGVMQFLGSADGGVGLGVLGLNGGFRFNDLLGNDNLWGSFATVLGSNDSGVIAYSIEGGTGLFSNAFGTGSSIFEITGGIFPYIFSYAEQGTLSVRTKGGAVSVAEPAVFAMFASALLALGWITRRRRAAIRS